MLVEKALGYVTPVADQQLALLVRIWQGGLALGIAGTIGGIAGQAAGPSVAVALSDEVPGTRPQATHPPPILPTKLQLATMMAQEELTDQNAAAAFRAVSTRLYSNYVKLFLRVGSDLATLHRRVIRMGRVGCQS